MTRLFFRSLLVRASLLLALGLVGINITGFFVGIRAPGIDGYIDIAGPTTTYNVTRHSLNAHQPKNYDAQALAEVTKLFNDGMAHIDPADIEAFGVRRFNGSVPITENYILYLLSYLKPDTYLDYEFCSYQKALERGTGRCGQQSLALVDFLDKKGVETGFVHVGDLHTLVTARSEDRGWILLDPDFGGMVPASAAEVSHNPEMVEEHYWYPNVVERNLHNAFRQLPIVEELGGPEVRWHRACTIEKVAYILKWGIPVMLIFLSLILIRRASGQVTGG